MARRPCRACGAQIYDLAEACRECGAADPFAERPPKAADASRRAEPQEAPKEEYYSIFRGPAASQGYENFVRSQEEAWWPKKDQPGEALDAMHRAIGRLAIKNGYAPHAVLGLAGLAILPTGARDVGIHYAIGTMFGVIA